MLSDGAIHLPVLANGNTDVGFPVQGGGDPDAKVSGAGFTSVFYGISNQRLQEKRGDLHAFHGRVHCDINGKVVTVPYFLNFQKMLYH